MIKLNKEIFEAKKINTFETKIPKSKVSRTKLNYNDLVRNNKNPNKNIKKIINNKYYLQQSIVDGKDELPTETNNIQKTKHFLNNFLTKVKLYKNLQSYIQKTVITYNWDISINNLSRLFK